MMFRHRYLESSNKNDLCPLKFSCLRDMWCLELALTIAEELRDRTGGHLSPFVVIARFARKCVDGLF